MFQTTSQTQYVGCLSEKAWTCPTTFKNMKAWPGAANSQTHPQRKKVPKLADTTWWQYPRAHGWHLIPKRVIGCCWKQPDMPGLEMGCIFWCNANHHSSYMPNILPTRPGNDTGLTGLTHGRHGCNEICYTKQGQTYFARDFQEMYRSPG